VEPRYGVKDSNSYGTSTYGANYFSDPAAAFKSFRQASSAATFIAAGRIHCGDFRTGTWIFRWAKRRQSRSAPLLFLRSTCSACLIMSTSRIQACI
jgi:hypothetical protein